MQPPAFSTAPSIQRSELASAGVVGHHRRQRHAARHRAGRPHVVAGLVVDARLPADDADRDRRRAGHAQDDVAMRAGRAGRRARGHHARARERKLQPHLFRRHRLRPGHDEDRVHHRADRDADAGDVARRPRPRRRCRSPARAAAPPRRPRSTCRRAPPAACCPPGTRAAAAPAVPPCRRDPHRPSATARSGRAAAVAGTARCRRPPCAARHRRAAGRPAPRRPSRPRRRRPRASPPVPAALPPAPGATRSAAVAARRASRPRSSTPMTTGNQPRSRSAAARHHLGPPPFSA